MKPLNIFHILIVLGSLQGFILASTFYNSKRYGRVSNKYLALLLLSSSMLNFMNLAWDLCLSCEYPILAYLPINWAVLLPFSLYYFVVYLIEPLHQPTWWRKVLLGPIILYFTVGLVRLILFICATEVLDRYDPSIVVINSLIQVVALGLCCVVLFLVFKRLNFFQRNLYNHFSNLEQKSLVWMRRAMAFIAFLTVAWVFAEFNGEVNYVPQRYIMYPIAIGMSLIIYWLAYMMHLRTDLFELPPEEVTTEQETIGPEMPSTRETVLSVNAENHYQKVLSLMSEQHLYRDPDLSMSSLATETGLSRGYLSQIINQKEGKNFFDFVNGYRIAEVKSHFDDPKYDHYTILAIGQESGFRSKSTFNAVFKKLTGVTPSQYRKAKS